MTEIVTPIRSDALDYEDIISRIKSIYNECSPLEQNLFLKILEELSDKGYSETLETVYLVDFKEVPVSIDRFLTDPYYLGASNDNGNQIYPGWWEAYHSVFDYQRDIYEVILSGATRIGKTSTAVSCMCYMTYLIMCYRNPQKYFGHKETMIPVVAFANLTKDLAKGVAFQEFCHTIKKSPWFNAHGKFSATAKIPLYTPENDAVELVVASDAAHILGMPTWALLIDEVNFARAGIKDISISKNHMKQLYNTANARITGTFKLNGRIYGKMFTCSSKNTDNDYLSEHIEQQLDAGNKHLYIYDKPQWEVLPAYRFGKEKFYITVGDRFKRGFVVADENSDEAHLQEYRNEGYKVLEVPADYKPNFKADYDIALRDIAGISVVGAMGFITQEMITPNVSEDRVNPFFEDYYEIGLRDNDTIERHFHAEVVPNNLKALPMNIHIDFAEVSDHIGISGVVIDGNKNVLDLQTERRVMMPFFRQIFQVAIGSPRGDRMSFQKVINFILWLKRNGFNIGIVSTDQYQSAYVRENLDHQGFTTEKVSVDRTIDPYISLRNLLQDQRIELVKCDLQEIEMINLQRNNDRIDHKPQGNCLTGDTKISLVDGRTLTIEELLLEHQYKTNWVYTVNESTGLIEPKPILDIFQTKITKDLVKVTLDNGEIIYCTPEHRFMLRDGSYEEAQKLCSGDSLMPLYTKLSSKGLDGYRLYYEPKTDDWHYEHRKFCYDPPLDISTRPVVHHCNYNKLDNRPSNLKRVTSTKHRQIHNNSTMNYSKVAESVAKWHYNNKGTEEYAQRNHKYAIKNIIRNHYARTGEKLTESSAEAIHLMHAEEYVNQQSRIHDIELLFKVNWDDIKGRLHNTLGLRLSRVIYVIEDICCLDWDTLSDSEKVRYYSEYDKFFRLHEFEIIAKQEIAYRLDRLINPDKYMCRSDSHSHKVTNKVRPKVEPKVKLGKVIKTLRVFNLDDIKIGWIEYLFNVTWNELTPGEKCKATRRFNRFVESGEYVPLDSDIIHESKKKHIIKSISLFGSAYDIKRRNIEEYCGIHLEDIPNNRRSGYSRIYNNFCKGHIYKDTELLQRIVDIEKTYNVVWSDLDKADKSKYSLMYHNLKNPECRAKHYGAIASAISQHHWYTDGVNNVYIREGREIPEGYYKGRTKSKESIEKCRATMENRSPEEKARISKIYSEANSRKIWVTNGEIDRYIDKDDNIPEGFIRGRCKHGKNHNVVSVEHVVMPCRVYDLTIQDNHNFALAAGIFVHNSGAGSALPCLANGYNSKGIGKDCADALCGACSSLIAHLDLIKPPAKSVINAINSVNTGNRGFPGFGGPGVRQPLPGFGTQYRKF